MSDHHDSERGRPREGHGAPRGGAKRPARGAPIEQERPIRITAEHVRISLRDAERRRSGTHVRTKQAARHRPTPRDERRDSAAVFRDRLWLTAGLTVPMLAWGRALPDALGFSPPVFAGAQWIPPVSGTAVFLYGGWPFLSGALREVKSRVPGSMTLLAVAITVAFGFSVAVTFGFGGTVLWEQLAVLIVVLLLSRWIETWSVSRAQGALRALAKRLPERASRVRGEAIEEVAVDEIKAGDVVLVRPGGRVPADGYIRDGSSHVDESLLTGASRPVNKGTGDRVIAGTVNLTGTFRFDVSATGEDTSLAAIRRLVEQAHKQPARVQSLAERAAVRLTVLAIVASIAALVFWLAVQPAEPTFAIERMVTVLVISCPQAFGFAVPLVAAISSAVALRNGLVIRDRRGLEEARRLTSVVFDKSGTLTLGEHRVIDVATVRGVGPADALRLAAAVERNLEHSIADAIRKSALEQGLEIPVATEFRHANGQGAKAVVEGRELAVGGPNLLDELKVDLDNSLAAAALSASARGQSTVYLVDGSRAVAAFAVADPIRPESLEAVQRLRRQGVEAALMTSDSPAVARAAAKQLGIRRVLAQVPPDEKARRIEELKSLGKKVAMVGDGVNDAKALAIADIGVAVGAGTDVSLATGDVVLVRRDPRDVTRLVRLSRVSYRKMIQNLWWAAGYNIIAISVAAGALAAQGIILSPAIGAVLMSASAIVAVVNAQSLRRLRL